MKEVPLIFTGAMVRAILEDRKTQTRRLPRPGGYGQPGDRLWVRETFRVGSWTDDGRFALDYAAGPVGKTLWCGPSNVTERHRLTQQSLEDCAQYMAVHGGATNCRVRDDGARYTWEVGNSPCRWRPSIHMPRWASRLTLEILEVRTEPLQAITAADVAAEGLTWKEVDYLIEDPSGTRWFDPVTMFAYLWDKLNGIRAPWYRNPEVTVITFKRVTP